RIESNFDIHNQTQDDDFDSSSDTSSDDFDDDGIEEVLEDLKTDAKCLMDLDPFFKNPLPDFIPRKRDIAPKAFEWAPQKAYCERIQQRFPQASDALVSILAEANWVRYQRLQSQRDSVNRTTHPGQRHEDSTTLAASKFHDSGIGTSLPTNNSYAETIMTYTAGLDGQSTRIPPLPERAKRGETFDCVACGRPTRVTNRAAWKSHLMADLKPYVCFEAKCHRFGFNNRGDWISHLELDHHYGTGKESVSCPLCGEQIDHGKVAITSHIAHHLEEISLSALPAGTDENDDGVRTPSSASPSTI
ncbi:hypothetical protein QBC34DRAFT_259321, partial [Podospora aff. communis PSN243]